MKKVVLTAIFGGHDYPKDPMEYNPEWEYIMLTDDQTITSQYWDVRVITPEGMGVGSPRELARRVKILTHEYIKFDVCLWVDGSTTLQADPDTLLAEIGQAHLLLKMHPSRETITQEVDACIDTGRIHEDTGVDWLEYCDEQGYTEQVQNDGLLYETGMYMKRNTSETFEMMRDWWRYTSKHTALRDQLSLPFVLWKHNVPTRVFSPDEFEAWGHLTKHQPNFGQCIEVARWVQPYAIDGNLGRAYNEAAAGLDADDWIAIMDQDICMLDSRMKWWIGRTLAYNEGRYDVFTCMTNRLSDIQQKVKNMEFVRDIVLHKKTTVDLWDAFGMGCRETTHPTAGLMMIMKVRTLRAVGFKNGLFFIDTDFYRRAVDMGFRFGIMRGIYVFHYYRFDKNKSSSHLHRKWDEEE